MDGSIDRSRKRREGKPEFLGICLPSDLNRFDELKALSAGKFLPSQNFKLPDAVTLDLPGKCRDRNALEL
ncbi:hypothetical protein MRB53_006969 [Persea americana]|uniref:Uncharacterized protein n=1 Tax=Persea americana TaxID=3435 RepID=A0ACC2MHK0_PERAE|nr:hypothetical protein MRB53_006969 [Persea americana]